MYEYVSVDEMASPFGMTVDDLPRECTHDEDSWEGCSFCDPEWEEWALAEQAERWYKEMRLEER